MIKEQQYEHPTSQPHSHGRKHRRGKPVHREEEGQVASKSVEFQSFQVHVKGATSMGGRQSVLPCRISTSSQSEIKPTSNNKYRFKRMSFGAKMSQDVFQMKMDLIMEHCTGVISIHNPVVYGVSDKDHDANLINLLMWHR